MERKFQKEIEGIYRLKVPFEDLYTSVFLIAAKEENTLVDCGTYGSDVDEIILPALRAFGLRLEDIRYLILTHSHGDHAGGLERMLERAPHLETVREICEITLDGVTMYEMKGHTRDCIGVLDMRTNTLISGDGLQGAGIGKYRCNLENKEEYLKTIEKIAQDERIKNVLFSHAYEPWHQDGVFGRKNVEKILRDCKNYV